jgi:ABC-type polysaccharide/polyol phosphate transport system ATPase subunit
MIKVEGISKRFKLYRSPADRLKEIFFRKQYHTDFVALDDISFEIGAGQTLGIIGQNGAGKSTLLKILSGIVIPDTGSIQIDGKVTGLLELGTGFNAEMTGLENIYMNGTLIGMTKDEIDQKKQTIIDFSELGEFIHEPIKTYSSGMVMRLAFSIAIHADPKCFLVDEALAVGDAYFQQKCMRKIQEFRAGGGSIVFVSHDLGTVQTLCDYAILLDHGKMQITGIPKNVIDYYQCSVLKEIHDGKNNLKNKRFFNDTKNVPTGLSTNEIEFIECVLLDRNNEKISIIESEAFLKISFTVRSLRFFDDPHYGFILRNKYGISIFETNSYCMKIKNPPLEKGDIVKIIFEMDVPLFPGDYSISVGVMNGGFGDGSFKEYLLYAIDVMMITIIKNRKIYNWAGIFNAKPSFTLMKTTE